MNYPKQIKARRKIDALTGIKSSLDHIRSVIALTYLLYIASGRKSYVRYSISDGTKIKIAPELLKPIEKHLGQEKLEEVINGNPLITNQYEPLYVGITLLLKLANLKMEGKQTTAERTGGVRYPKQLYFANNMLVLDLILQGFSEEIRNESLCEWLQNKKASDNQFEERVSMFITTCTCFTQFKLRDNTNQELFFQTEGLYQALIEGEDGVIYSDSHEFVGPTRIYNNVLKEGLEPWLDIKKSILNMRWGINPDAESISQMLSTTLDIYNVKDDSSLSETDMEDDHEKDIEEGKTEKCQLQRIYYGAPGTGKSHEVKMMTNKDNSIRTTFHPDSDYSTFVGAYKPIVDERPRYGLNQKETVRLMDEDKQPLNEKTITYAFVPQAFIKAYAEAWSRYAKWQQGNGEGQPQSYYLVIEEINRGNCAQIFGDLFQLLDRCGNGLSGYAISPDNDIQRYLSETEFDPSKAQWGLHNLELTGMFVDDEGEVLSTADEIKSGRLMLLPPNLYIWATMNTSDQSLFPIDSAFKRRWEWKYMPINNHEDKGYQIEIGDAKYDWWGFLARINHVINDTTNSEDKKLGYFFAKAKDKTIDAEQFVGKVLFYLWNDVFKSYGFDDPIFSKGDNTKFEFSDFFMNNGTPNTDTVNLFLRKLEETIKMEKTPMEIKPDSQDNGQGE